MSVDDTFEPVLKFFDDLKADEIRLRWDRLVVFHLFLITCINAFGYGFQQTKKDELACVVERIRHDKICENLVGWLKEYRWLWQSTYGQNLQTVSHILKKELEKSESR